MLRVLCFVLVVGGLLPLVSPAEAAPPQEASKPSWKKLPATAAGPWEPCNFGGDGDVVIEDGVIELGFGDPLTGVRLDKPFPKDNFEIALEARRTTGYDFFCGLTFPVGEGHCSFILGGWGGGVVGLSSIDRMDASENETTAYKVFDNEEWFQVRVRVRPEQIDAWINGKVFADVPRKDREFTIRTEMDPTLPVGIACYQCTAEIRNVRWRKLPAAASETPAPAEDSEGNESSR